MKHRAMCVLVAAVTLGLGTACTASDVKPPKQPHVDQAASNVAAKAAHASNPSHVRRTRVPRVSGLRVLP